MKKRIGLLSTILLTCFMAAGCVNLDVDISVDKRGNITSSASMSMPSYLVKDTDSLKESILNESPEAEIEIYESEGKTFATVKNSLGNVLNLHKGHKKSRSGPEDIIQIEKENGFLYNKYNCAILLEDTLNDKIDNSNKYILSMMDNILDFKFTLRLPLQVETNSTEYIKDNNGLHTYTWDYEFSDIEDMHISVKVPNFKLIFTIMVVLLAAIVYWICRRKNKKSINADTISESIGIEEGKTTDNDIKDEILDDKQELF